MVSFSKVLSVIKPSSKELRAELKFSEMMVHKIQSKAPKNCMVTLSGSVAKRTFLREKKDLDIFVLFERSYPRKKLESAIIRIMKAAFPSIGYQVSYAEHPYVRFHYHGRRIDLVPAYKISDSSQRISAVDRSVLHTKFVRKKLKKKQIDDVLLLKQFLQVNSLYGAEIKIEGFSGYLCELLIIKYKSFRRLVGAATKWKVPLLIDIKKYYKGKKQIEKATSNLGNFVVIDPTDKNRNVAAAVSVANLQKFIRLCKRFANKPSSSVFLKKPESFDQKVSKAAKRHNVFLISMPRPDIVDDVLWGQLRKMMKQLSTYLHEFNPKAIFADDLRHIIRIAIPLDEDLLSSTIEVQGPPLSMKKHVQKFKEAHKRSKIIKKRQKVYAIKKRVVRKAETAIIAFLRSFSSSKSHLAYPKEMVVVERVK